MALSSLGCDLNHLGTQVYSHHTRICSVSCACVYFSQPPEAGRAARGSTARQRTCVAGGGDHGLRQGVCGAALHGRGEREQALAAEPAACHPHGSHTRLAHGQRARLVQHHCVHARGCLQRIAAPDEQAPAQRPSPASLQPAARALCPAACLCIILEGMTPTPCSGAALPNSPKYQIVSLHRGLLPRKHRV